MPECPHRAWWMYGDPSVFCMGVHYGLQGSLLSSLVCSWETCTGSARALALPFWHRQKREWSGAGINKHSGEWEVRFPMDPWARCTLPPLCRGEIWGPSVAIFDQMRLRVANVKVSVPSGWVLGPLDGICFCIWPWHAGFLSVWQKCRLSPHKHTRVINVLCKIF